MSPISADEAFRHTSDDPTAYNLPPDASDDQVNAARRVAASNILAGVAANDAYWNSRGELEQVIARAQGHGVVQRGEQNPEPDTQTAPAIEGTAVHETAPAGVPEGTAPVGMVGETAMDTGPAPTPDNSVEAVATLRAQVEALGGTPEA